MREISQTPEASTQNGGQEVELRRRRFWTKRRLKAAAFIGAAISGLNVAAANFVQDKRPPEIVSIQSNPQSHDYILAIDGMGGEGTDLFCTLDAFDSRNVYGIHHRGRVDIDYTVGELLNYIQRDEVQSITVSGTSAGGLMALPMAAKLIDAGVHVPEVHIVTSPIAPFDVRSGLAQAMVRNEWLMRGAGLMWRFAGEAVREAGGKNETPFSEDIERAQRRTIKLPNRVIEAQGAFVAEGADRQQLKTILRSGARVVYFAPSDDDQDRTVNTAWAFPRLRALAEDVFLELGYGPIVSKQLARERVTRVRAGADHALIPHAEHFLLAGGDKSLWVQETNAQSANDVTAIMGYKYMAERPGSPFAECAPSYNSAGQSLLAGKER